MLGESSSGLHLNADEGRPLIMSVDRALSLIRRVVLWKARPIVKACAIENESGRAIGLAPRRQDA
jgi:hypothetical protein